MSKCPYVTYHISKCPSRRNCHTCQHIQDGTRTVTFLNTNKTFGIRQSLDCNSTDIIHLLQGKQCPHDKKTDCQYIGQTGRRIRYRFNEHRRDIMNKRTDTSGVADHFCKPGQSVQGLKLLPLLQVYDTRESVKAGFHLCEFVRTIARPVVWACVVCFNFFHLTLFIHKRNPSANQSIQHLMTMINI